MRDCSVCEVETTHKKERGGLEGRKDESTVERNERMTR